MCKYLDYGKTFWRQWYIMMLTATLMAASCSREPASMPAASAGLSTNQQAFEVKGLLKKMEPGSRIVTIQHEEVPNYMPAMTMPLTVKDTNELRGLAVGDSLSFRLNVTGDESWIDELRKTATASINESPVRPPVRQVREVEPLKEGDLLPDYRFTNELGRAVSVSDFKGKALSLTFIFTRCPIPEFCPLMSKNYSAVEKQLAALPNAPTNWHLLTISFDPHFDTPEVLRNYARLFRQNADRWSFLTGAMIDIDAITEQFELPVVKQGESWEHKLRTAVIDVNGRIQKIFLGNQWTAGELVSELVKAAATERKPEP